MSLSLIKLKWWTCAYLQMPLQFVELFQAHHNKLREEVGEKPQPFPSDIYGKCSPCTTQVNKFSSFFILLKVKWQ